jgi:Tol biopolymer transport system component
LIGFTRFDDNGASIYVMRRDGTHLEQVPGIAGLDDASGGSWSPDGTHLVINGTTGTGRRAIYTIRLDGTHARRVTPWKLHPGGVDWSPDGRWILTVSHTEQDGQNNLYLVHPNGTDLHRITRAPAHVHQWGSFSFSPDGTMITVAFNAGEGIAPDIWVLNIDGSGPRDVSASPFFDSAPDWGARRS